MPIDLTHIERIARSWLDLITVISIQWGIFLAFIYVISFLLKKQSARFLYLIWLVGLIKVLVPPKIILPEFFPNPSIIHVARIPVLLPEIDIESIRSAGLSLPGYLWVIWVCIATGLLGYWVYRLIQFRINVIGTSVEITDCQRLCSSVFGSDRIRLFVVPGISMPFTWGIFRPKIYLPEAILSWPDQELRALLLHEFAHIKRKDLWVIPFQNVLQILFFFHPLVWLANRQLSRYREQACDDFAIHWLQGNRVNYGKLLLKSISQTTHLMQVPVLTSYFHQSKKFIIQRFNYLLNRKETVMIHFNLLQKLAIIAVLIVGVALSCQQQATSPVEKTMPQPPVPPPSASGDASLFVPYDQPPMPIGGFEAIQRNIVYPEAARKAGIEGITIVYVHVNEKGIIDSTKILQSSDPIYGCAEAAIAALKAVQWKPAMQKQQPVAVWVSVPVRFKLR